MPDFLGWAYSDLVITGPDPFSSNASANSSSVGASTITITNGASPTVIAVTDGDSEFTEGDSDQRYQGPADFNGGVGFNVGDRIETEYSYIIRPSGSSDPADNITIYMLEIDADGQGIASDAPLTPSVTYDVVAIDSSNPVVQYSSLYICFAGGTHIQTPSGETPVERLRVGDLVETMDCGPMHLRWIGKRTLHFPNSPERQKPIEFKPGSLGDALPNRPLVVSPQHCLLRGGNGATTAREATGDVLMRAKDLVTLRRVRRMKGCRQVTYYSLLFDQHQIIFAEGVAAESFFPGRYSLGLLSTLERSELYAMYPN